MKPIAQDKASHIIVNFFAVQFGATLAALASAPIVVAIAFGAIASLAASLWKELVYDQAMRKGQPSWADMAANAVGLLMGLWPWGLVYGVFLA